jgi:hypothetical protein
LGPVCPKSSDYQRSRFTGLRSPGSASKGYCTPVIRSTSRRPAPAVPRTLPRSLLWASSTSDFNHRTGNWQLFVTVLRCGMVIFCALDAARDYRPAFRLLIMMGPTKGGMCPPRSPGPGACDLILVVECVYLFSESLRRMRYNRELRDYCRDPAVSMHEGCRMLQVWHQLIAHPTVDHDGLWSGRTCACRRRVYAGAVDRTGPRRTSLPVPSGDLLSAAACSYLAAAAAG